MPELLDAVTKDGTVEDATTNAPDVIATAGNTGDSSDGIKISLALEKVQRGRDQRMKPPTFLSCLASSLTGGLGLRMGIL